MHIRRFFFVSLGLAVLAIGFDMAAMSQHSRAARALARAVLLSEGERSAAKLQSHTYRSRGTVLGVVGFAFALASFAFMIVSARNHEPAWRSVTFAALIFYVMLQFGST